MSKSNGQSSVVIDPEIRALIPPLAPEEREQLKENLKAEGCRDALVVWSGGSICNVLLDGHNRHEICEELGIGYRVVERDFPDRNAAEAWVIRNQFGRRNLNDFQRAELALKLERLIAAESLKRERAGKPVDPPQNSAEGRHERETRNQVAAAAGVSHDTIGKVKAIAANGHDSLKDLAREGKVSIDAASKVARLPKSEQKKVAADGPKAVKQKAKEIREAVAEPVAEVVKDQEGQVISDPAIQEAFRNAEKIDAALQRLSEISELLNPLMGGKADVRRPGGEMLDRTAIQVDIKQLRRDIKIGRPYALCPYPAKSHAKCEGCKGLGWVIEGAYLNAPKSFTGGKGAA